MRLLVWIIFPLASLLLAMIHPPLCLVSAGPESHIEWSGGNSVWQRWMKKEGQERTHNNFIVQMGSNYILCILNLFFLSIYIQRHTKLLIVHDPFCLGMFQSQILGSITNHDHGICSICRFWCWSADKPIAWSADTDFEALNTKRQWIVLYMFVFYCVLFCY